jgi:hypothetical protein
VYVGGLLLTRIHMPLAQLVIGCCIEHRPFVEPTQVSLAILTTTAFPSCFITTGIIVLQLVCSIHITPCALQEEARARAEAQAKACACAEPHTEQP